MTRIYKSACSLFILRALPFSHFDFPRWQAALSVTLIGVVFGFDPHIGLPLWIAIPSMVLSIWASFLVILGVLRWWMNRGSRWDGQGDIFNLLATSWLVVNMMGAGLIALGVPALLTLPLGPYSVWVSANALSGAIPNASLLYSIGGIAIGVVLAIIVYSAMLALFNLFAGFLPFYFRALGIA